MLADKFVTREYLAAVQKKLEKMTVLANVTNQRKFQLNSKKKLAACSCKEDGERLFVLPEECQNSYYSLSLKDFQAENEYGLQYIAWYCYDANLPSIEIFEMPVLMSDIPSHFEVIKNISKENFLDIEIAERILFIRQKFTEKISKLSKKGDFIAPQILISFLPSLKANSDEFAFYLKSVINIHPHLFTLHCKRFLFLYSKNRKPTCLPVETYVAAF